MEDSLTKLLETYSFLKKEIVNRSYKTSSGEETISSVFIKGVPGISDEPILIRDTSDVDHLLTILNSGCVLLSDLLGYYDTSTIHVMARPERAIDDDISFRPRISNRDQHVL